VQQKFLAKTAKLRLLTINCYFRRSTKESYDVFLSAERQMQELLGSPLPSRKSQPYVVNQQTDIELNLDENFIKVEESISNGHTDFDEEDEDSSIEEALNDIQHQDSFSSVEIFKDEDDEPKKDPELWKEDFGAENEVVESGNQIREALQSIKEGVEEAFKEDNRMTEDDVLDQLKATLESSLDGCPLTDSLSYLDAALSLFQLEDIPMRPRDSPRTKASSKRRQYSATSALSLLTPDPGQKQQQCSECGSAFPVQSAKFCCLCGAKRSV